MRKFHDMKINSKLLTSVFINRVFFPFGL